MLVPTSISIRSIIPLSASIVLIMIWAQQFATRGCCHTFPLCTTEMVRPCLQIFWILSILCKIRVDLNWSSLDLVQLIWWILNLGKLSIYIAASLGAHIGPLVLDSAAALQLLTRMLILLPSHSHLLIEHLPLSCDPYQLRIPAQRRPFLLFDLQLVRNPSCLRLRPLSEQVPFSTEQLWLDPSPLQVVESLLIVAPVSRLIVDLDLHVTYLMDISLREPSPGDVAFTAEGDTAICLLVGRDMIIPL